MVHPDEADRETTTPSRPRSRSRWRYALLASVVVFVALGSVASVQLVRGARSSDEFWFVSYFVQYSFSKECGTVRRFDDNRVVLDYMAGDFLGPGDGYSTDPLPRDVLSPELRDGEEVQFDLDGDRAEDVERPGCG